MQLYNGRPASNLAHIKPSNPTSHQVHQPLWLMSNHIQPSPPHHAKSSLLFLDPPHTCNGDDVDHVDDDDDADDDDNDDDEDDGDVDE